MTIPISRPSGMAGEGRSTRPSTTSATIRAGPSNPPRTKAPNRHESGLIAALLSGWRIAGPEITRSGVGRGGCACLSLRDLLAGRRRGRAAGLDELRREVATLLELMHEVFHLVPRELRLE